MEGVRRSCNSERLYDRLPLLLKPILDDNVRGMRSCKVSQRGSSGPKSQSKTMCFWRRIMAALKGKLLRSPLPLAPIWHFPFTSSGSAWNDLLTITICWICLHTGRAPAKTDAVELSSVSSPQAEFGLMTIWRSSQASIQKCHSFELNACRCKSCVPRNSSG